MIVKASNGTIVNNLTLAPGANDMTLTLATDGIDSAFTIFIAAENQEGLGPFSSPLNLDFASLPVTETEINNDTTPLEEERKKQIWIISAVSAAIFVLILISAIICYKRKFNKRRHHAKPMGYLAASTTVDDINCQLSNIRNPIIKNQDASLWIDRRWADSCEKDSNSSEKKLLSNHHCHHQHSNSDTEYAYVTEKQHNISQLTNSSASSRSRKNAESPEPYATTDIFQRHFSTTTSNHYAVAPSVYNYTRRNVHSCDNLIAEPQPSQHYAQHMIPHNYQRSSVNSKKPTRNLLDMIPPPPCHPPPPPTPSSNSIESVISPKYLFAHPMYQGTQHQIYPQVPSKVRSHYEQVDALGPRLVFDRECHDELEHFNAMLGQFGTAGKNSEKYMEADDEDDEDSSLTSHKSTHY